ncbi:MAG: FprA family A-type flavoprotein [Nitrospirota bacterium]|nr:FprA family A-type flavoprotein [Nitrospirota bacterium]
MKTMEIAKNVHWVGALDPDLKIFDIIIPTEFGTCYNSYLIKGETTAVIDAVKPEFADLFIEKIRALHPPDKIDYIITNHTELDHSGAIPDLLKLSPQAEVVHSRAARSFVKNVIGDGYKSREVGDNDQIDLGGKTLRFFQTPFLHWPDTMFTYLVEDQVLFPCDVFGAHFCDEKLFNDSIEAKTQAWDAFIFYYEHIMRPFSEHIASAVDKLKGLPIRMIAPSHGPVLREMPGKYIEWYRRRAVESVKREEKSVVVAYCSAYGNTQQMAEAIAEGLRAAEADVIMFDAATADMREMIDAIERADSLLLGTPTINAKAPKPIFDLIASLVLLNVRGKKAAVFGCYGWSGEAVKMVEEILRNLKFEILQDGLRQKMSIRESDLEQCRNFGQNFVLALQGIWSGEVAGGR